MSKQRPSTYWGKRVFRNTYTRGGKLHRVKGWRVKIQHQGIRRAFSLKGRTRAKAAAEAEILQTVILGQGWKAALERYRASKRLLDDLSGSEEPAKTDLGYWKERLLLRKHPGQTPIRVPGEYSTRIEHEGISQYFPLGTLNEERAAAQALTIYRTLLREGWKEVNRRYRREVTIAFHWAANPIAWTYTTCHTLIGAKPPRVLKGRSSIRIALIERDDELRAAIAKCVTGQRGIFASVFATAPRRDFREMRAFMPELALINEGADITNFSRKIPLVRYSVHEDSDQLFKSTPGGASGYLLKRALPEEILKPLEKILDDRNLNTARIAGCVRKYFQDLIATLPASDLPNGAVRLTEREHEILNLLSKGFVDKEIALSLRISIWTVHGHLKNIFEKMGVHTRTEAAVKYLHK